jgi:hypothetical protein
MDLGDAFARRKQLDAEITTWINRLSLAGRNTQQYKTKSTNKSEKDAYSPIPGTQKEYIRNYTIEECQEKIQAFLKEDLELALRISLTNQKAKGKFIDLDGKEKEMTIPELLVYRNDIAPKYERAATAIPRRATGVEITEKGEKSIKWRQITPNWKVKQEMNGKGLKIENTFIEDFFIDEVEDFGHPERKVFDEIDRIHEWMVRIKTAINQANKTELVKL